jgi:hypothetical protein
LQQPIESVRFFNKIFRPSGDNRTSALQRGDRMRIGRKLTAISALVFASILIALAPMANTLCGEVYPANPARKEALRKCERADPAFNRLIAAARSACYGNHPNAEPATHTAPPPASAVGRGSRIT